MARQEKAAAHAEDASRFGPGAPQIFLPRGGGAIRGIGEKFSANPVTGTGSTAIPIVTSRGRDGFGPQLTLSYDSGSGNGPFGFGWSLALPSIARRTDQGLPQYHDAEDSDIFILSGAEDLVPSFKKETDGQFTINEGRHVVDDRQRTSEGIAYTVRTYRPRVEGLFARIERWTRNGDDDVHWRSISRDNVLSLYGKDADSRVADPDDARRVFRWLICETRDDKGNAVLYEYKREDGTGIDLGRACERNRGDLADNRRSANRYLKRILYGNRQPLLDSAGQRPQWLPASTLANVGWMFEVVLDYGEHDSNQPTPNEIGVWICRDDAFSSYRSCFEIRTNRLCRRILMFHHIPDLTTGQKGYDGLVHSTDFTYSMPQNAVAANAPSYAFLNAVTQTGYRPTGTGYAKRSLPSLTFEYSQAVVQDRIESIGPDGLENLPAGVDGTAYRWIDLHGEGIPGILTEQAGAWFYKRNLSPDGGQPVAFAPLERVSPKPNATLRSGRAQFMDVTGDGVADLLVLDGPALGFHEHDQDESWQPFRPFSSRLYRDMRDPNLRLIDLDGDGRADVLITEDDALIWHASLAEAGYGPPQRIPQAGGEERGPHLLFADGTQSIYLADMSGDGLTDLVRIRNSEVSYWPNLGYGRFGPRISMDHAPHFDNPEQFNQQNIRLADIDGSGTTDIVYLHRDGVRLYFNRSGNEWSEPHQLPVFPRTDDLTSVAVVDLLGNGTACLLWSSPRPADSGRQMRFVNLMGDSKPHLLVKIVNNLGAETVIHYASSTRFYLQDKRAGRPWITRLPFPVHVVDRIESYDRISRNRFVSRYAYHHGYFDGIEREFGGFGMVEQWDTEEIGTITGSTPLRAANHDPASYVPPVLTRSWFHTGVSLGRRQISDYFAGLLDPHDKGEYYREPGLTDAEIRAMQLPEPALPPGLTPEEEREACRALRGSLLRREIYALDGTAKQPHPYTVLQQTFGIRLEQPRNGSRYAIFFPHPQESISHHYERNPEASRVQHSLALQYGAYGDVLKQASIGYGRLTADPSLNLPIDQKKQTTTLITYTEQTVTNPTDEVGTYPDVYRTPCPAETLAFELTGLAPAGAAKRFSFEEWTRNDFALAVGASEIQFEQDADHITRQKRTIRHTRTLYRPDDLGSSDNNPLKLLPLGNVQSRAVSGEIYRLALTPGLLAKVYVRGGQALMPAPADVLGGQGGGRGGYLQSQQLKADGRFTASDPDDHWWIPSGRQFLSPGGGDAAAQELAYARAHFSLPRRIRDPFHSTAFNTESVITYDAYDLMLLDMRDALGNRITAGERRTDGSIDPAAAGNDYRVLQPTRVMDANRNRTQVAFDALGMVVGTAVLGKSEETLGDSLAGFVADLDEAVALAHIDQPLTDPQSILARATTRQIYDLFAYQRTANHATPAPAVAYTLAREIHDADLATGAPARVRHSFAYSDGFGRVIQSKLQAAPEQGTTAPRWVCSGWRIYNNKGKPVRQYEPFFTVTPGFEFGVASGVSAILLYDPLERCVATVYPNHSYAKAAFGSWSQTTWDVNDTIKPPLNSHDPSFDPKDDPDVGRYFAQLPPDDYLPTWYDLRTDPAKALAAWPDTDAVGHPLPDNAKRRASEQRAAAKAALHAGTPTTSYFDPLGRSILVFADSGPDPANPGQHLQFATRNELDIEGNCRSVRDAVVQAGDAQGRIVMHHDYDMAGNVLRQDSMEAGARWSLSDAVGKPLRLWDSRGHTFFTEFDPLRRPVRALVAGTDPIHPDRALLAERMVYGEQHPDAEPRNLRGRLFMHLDQSGAVANEGHDFKGNLLSTTRRIAKEYKATIGWDAVDTAIPSSATSAFDATTLEAALAPWLETGGGYKSAATYDALNRPATQTTPYSSTMKSNVIRFGYNEAALLERVDVNLRGEVTGGQPAWTTFVANVDYDAKGQRQHIDYGNGVNTFYDYDPLTFRLMRLLTQRKASAFPGDCPDPPVQNWPGCRLQNLNYTYDPVGNITQIRDDAQQTIFFRNKRVEPTAEYTYDALYRLIEATGREHLGQTGGAINPPTPHSYDDAPRVGIGWSANDGTALGTFVEKYVYDAAGNFARMQHIGADPAQAGWTRTYTYGETSQIEDRTGGSQPKTSNRLTSTTIGSAAPESYVHDVHGNMIRMPHLSGTYPAPNMQWDHRDHLAQVELGGGGKAYYVYDASGERIRKVWEKSASLSEERIYLGGFEIYRRRQGTQLLERETLHLTDGKQRIAIVETRTVDTAGTDGASQRLIRYQLGNHLGSACIELDDQAQIVSYEEYSPYGSTLYQAVRSQTETPKRYRYTGKERDEESGLYYHGARYYAPWLGRWTSCDPAGVGPTNPNPYIYVSSNPILLHDPTGRDGEIPPVSTGSMGFGADLGYGVWLGLKDAVIGLKDLAVGAYNVSPVNKVVNPGQWMKSTAKLQGTVSTIVDHPSVLWQAIKEPYVKAWNEGRPGEAIGRGVFEAVTIVAGTKGLDKVAKSGSVATAVVEIEKVAAVTSKVEEVAVATTKLEKATSASAKLEEVAAGTSKAETSANATAKSARLTDGGQVGEGTHKSEQALETLKTLEKADVVVKESKWDYFFGRVKSSPHNEARSIQIAKDLETLGIKQAEGGQQKLMELFQEGLSMPQQGGPHITEFGTTITRRVKLGDLGAIDVKYFYRGGNLSAIPEISSIIPKIF